MFPWFGGSHSCCLMLPVAFFCVVFDIDCRGLDEFMFSLGRACLAWVVKVCAT